MTLGLYVHRQTPIHRVPAAVKVLTLAAAGIGPGTIRLSVGIEDADDLVWDLENGLKAAEGAA